MALIGKVKWTAISLGQIFLVCVSVAITIHFMKRPPPATAPAPVIVTNPAQVHAATSAALADTAQKKPTIIERILGTAAPAPMTSTVIYRNYNPIDSVLISRLFLISRAELSGRNVAVTAFQQSTRTMMKRTFRVKFHDWTLATNSSGPFITQYRDLFFLNGVYLGPAWSTSAGWTAKLWASADVYESVNVTLSIEPKEVTVSAGYKLW